MVPSTKENGMSRVATDTVEATKYGATAVFMKDIGKMIKQTAVVD